MKAKRNLIQICLLCVAMLLARISANGGVVTTLADDGPGSLRQTIGQALSGDTIEFATNGTIILTTGELVLDKSLTIVGPGATNLVVSGNHASRVFNISSNVTVSISGLTICDGNAPGDGGGICNFGNLVLTNCLVTANGAGGIGGGGGICSFGPLALTACSVSDNTAGSGPAPGPPSPPDSNGGNGGGIYCANSLILANCTISGNSAGNGFGPGGFGGRGGGIYGNGLITLIACTVNSNSAGTGCNGNGGRNYIGGGPGGSGGGIYGAGTLMEIVDSTISSNMAGNGGNDSEFPGDGGSGGGVYSVSPLTLTNCTISANSAGQGGNDGNGGGIYCADLLTLVACTVSGNDGGFGGGVFCATSGGLINSLIALNTANSYPDLDGSFTSQGHNLLGQIEGSSGLTNNVNGDLVGSVIASLNPLLGPLADNGGLTWTMALLPGSPAIDAGNDVLLVFPYYLSTDQRGFARKMGAHVDIGAFEYRVLPSISNISVQSNSYSFSISGDSNMVVVVEACTNFSNPDWQPVQTNTLISGLACFSDPQWTNYSSRFFRLRSP